MTVTVCGWALNSHFEKALLKIPLLRRMALIAYLAGLAIVGFWPTPVDKPIQGTLSAFFIYIHNHGFPAWLDYQVVESTANVAMFIPLGLLIALALSQKAWWLQAGFGALVSTCLELGQMLFLTARYPSLVDVVTNSLGCLIGIVLCRMATGKEHRKA